MNQEFRQFSENFVKANFPQLVNKLRHDFAVDDYHINTYLDNMLISYLQAPSAFIADQVCQRVPVNNLSGKIPVMGVSHMRTVNALGSVETGETSIVSLDKSADVVYNCLAYQLGIKISRLEISNSSITQLREWRIQSVLELLRIYKEKLVADLLQTTTNYIEANRLTSISGTALWDAYLTTTDASKVIANIIQLQEAVRTSSGKEPNTLIIPAKVNAILAGNPGIKSLNQSVMDLRPNIGMPSTFMGMNVIVGKAQYITDNLSVDGLDTRLPIWSNSAIVAYIPPPGSNEQGPVLRFDCTQAIKGPIIQQLPAGQFGQGGEIVYLLDGAWAILAEKRPSDGTTTEITTAAIASPVIA